MDSNEANQTSFLGPHLPLTLLAGAAIMFFVSQLGGIRQGTSSMNWQLENAEKAIENLDKAKTTLTNNLESPERKQMVAQAQQSQKIFTELMNELNELAKSGDKDAELIMKGYGITVKEPQAGSAPAPAPAPEAKKEEKPPAP